MQATPRGQLLDHSRDLHSLQLPLALRAVRSAWHRLGHLGPAIAPEAGPTVPAGAHPRRSPLDPQLRRPARLGRAHPHRAGAARRLGRLPDRHTLAAIKEAAALETQARRGVSQEMRVRSFSERAFRVVVLMAAHLPACGAGWPGSLPGSGRGTRTAPNGRTAGPAWCNDQGKRWSTSRTWSPSTRPGVRGPGPATRQGPRTPARTGGLFPSLPLADGLDEASRPL
jgi:hypothetical protein